MAEENPTDVNEEPQAQDPQAQGAEADQATATAEAPGEDGVQVQKAEFPDAGEDTTAGQEAKIDLLLDASIPVSVQIGSVEMAIRDLLKLGQGSVLKLSKRIGQPIDLYIRGIRFATGDVVVIGDQLGVRIREILSSQAMEGITL